MGPDDLDVDDPTDVEFGPYVCPGCYAVGGEPCAAYCIDAEIEREREDALTYGDPERWDEESDDGD